MTITRLDDGTNIQGWYRSVSLLITPGTVVAGGEAVTAAQLGLASIVHFPSFTLDDATGGGAASNIRFGIYNAGSGKVQYFSASGTEATGDLSSYAGRVTVLGKG